MHRLAGSLILSCLALGADAAALRRAGQPAEPAPEAAPAAAAGLSHVLVVSAAEGVAEEKLVGVLVEAGASREEASAVVQRVAAEGESAVAQGPEEAMARLKAAFSAIGVEAQVKTVEELQKQLMADASEFAGSDVTELSLDDAKEWLSGEEGVLVAFYGHACAHCKSMVGAFKEAATALKPSGVRVGALNLQAIAGGALIAEALQVQALPTVRFVVGGNHLEYTGDRSSPSLIAFASAAHKGDAKTPEETAKAAREAAAAAEAAAKGEAPAAGAAEAAAAAPAAAEAAEAAAEAAEAATEAAAAPAAAPAPAEGSEGEREAAAAEAAAEGAPAAKGGEAAACAEGEAAAAKPAEAASADAEGAAAPVEPPADKAAGAAPASKLAQSRVAPAAAAA